MTPKVQPDDFGNGSELHALYALVDLVAQEMKVKLQKKFHEGYSGWHDPELAETIEHKLREHVEKPLDARNLVDILNLAAMLWNFKD